jgi:hypothetical protein
MKARIMRVVASEAHVARKRTGVQPQAASRPVDGLNASPKNQRVLAEQPQRVDHVARRDGRTRHLREHRLKHHVVLLGNQAHLQTGTPAKLPAKRFGTIHPGKATAEDGDIQLDDILVAHVAIQVSARMIPNATRVHSE